MRFFERRRHRAFEADIEQMSKEVQAEGATSLLDVGGTGVITEALANGAVRVVVVEPHAKDRARGAKRRPHIEFHAGRAEALPFPDGSFDRVISVVALHHFSDQTAALREMKRVTALGGRLVVFEMQPEHAPGRFCRHFAGHTHFLEGADLSKMVEAAGYRAPRVVESSSGYILTADA